jgi:hypothetical protein
MLPVAVRRRVARWRQPRPAARIARALWIAWAVLVWNVVFDHVIVVAGRDYIAAARRAAAVPGGPFANVDAWMRPAVSRAFWIATASGIVVLLVGLIVVGRAARSAAGREPEGIPRPSRDERLALRGKTR